MYLKGLLSSASFLRIFLKKLIKWSTWLGLLNQNTELFNSWFSWRKITNLISCQGFLRCCPSHEICGYQPYTFGCSIEAIQYRSLDREGWLGWTQAPNSKRHIPIPLWSFVLSTHLEFGICILEFNIRRMVRVGTYEIRSIKYKLYFEFSSTSETLAPAMGYSIPLGHLTTISGTSNTLKLNRLPLKN